MPVQKIAAALNKAFLKVKPNRSQIEAFKLNLIQLLDRANEEESEEFHKTLVRDFLKKTYYDPQHFINTKGRNDLVIHNGNKATSAVGVIIEAKKPSNKSGMLSTKKLNVKALHELLLYFLRERISEKNVDLKNLIATNLYEWFVFDANEFEKLFAQDKKLVKQFEDFEAGRLSGQNTDFFYREIATPAIAKVEAELAYTFVDIRKYEKPLRNQNPKDDAKLIKLYKLLSPEHMLKLPFANDSNSLDKKFYGELLHIIGLTETKKGSKKLIERNKSADRNQGSLLENAIIQLDSLDSISRLDNAKQYGENREERLFNVGLELSITWVNRILFLKLLEAQLFTYHQGNLDYAFLSFDKIPNYDALNKLFFQVLAKQYSERSELVKDKFAKVPYLNSSLFEPSEIEHSTLFISNLEDDYQIPIYGSTVLKDSKGKKRSGKLNSLQYLFEFLSAYDFSSEGSEEIQEDNKSLINASVLGLIFEKINGYKDGSFFTPGFITMYMCRETIRKAVLQKFNEAKGWNCETLDELYDKIEDREEANQLINQIKICDPAVGSGHFLVSALNEMIALKSELKILQDRQGKRLKEYEVEVVNDELIVTDEEGELFEYRPQSKESQRVQETLFHEKQTLIENCLFGVDLNPNSVKICRLRLWIELLKHAYYKTDFGSAQSTKKQSQPALETLPNIDINIKCGNSLISRFDLDADLRQVLKESKYSIDSYKVAVDTYRNAKSKEQKREMEALIEAIKSDFRTEIGQNSKEQKQLDRLGAELYQKYTAPRLLDVELKRGDKTKQETARKKLEKKINALKEKIDNIKNNSIYENAFEWRFEFPEVLNEEGDFMGFEVVIGNPPYMRVQEIQASQANEKLYYEDCYTNAKAAYDLANIFFELAVNISSKDSNNSFIFPHKFFNSASSEVFRNYLKEGQYIDEIAHFGANMVFDDADTYTCVTQFSSSPANYFMFQRFPFKSDFKNLMIDSTKYGKITYKMLDRASALYGGNQWILFDFEKGIDVFEKLYFKSKKLSEVLEGIFQGIATSKDKLYVVDCISENPFTIKVPLTGEIYKVEKTLFKPFLMGKDVQRFSHLKTNKYVFFPYQIKEGEASVISINELKENFPLTSKYVFDNEHEFKNRESGKAGRMEHWHTYIYPKNLNRFEQKKLSSMEICAKHPNVTINNDNIYHNTKVYSWVLKEDSKESYEYLLAIANSKLMWWFLNTTGDTLQGDARTFKTNYLNPFPIPKQVSSKIESSIQSKVSQILTLKKEDPAADTSTLEAEIDALVYELYGLSEEEIRIVEESVG